MNKTENNKDMRMKKLFMLLVAAASAITTAWAQTGTYGTDPNTATISASGSTLTINVNGDASGITGTVNLYTKYFTDAAVGNVFTSNTGAAVSNTLVYSPGNTYYTANRTWTQLFEGGVPTTVGNYMYSVTNGTYWKESMTTGSGKYMYGISNATPSEVWKADDINLYTITGGVDGEGKVTIVKKIADGSDEYVNPYEHFEYNSSGYIYLYLVASSGDYNNGEKVDVSNVTLLTDATVASYKKSVMKLTIDYYGRKTNGAYEAKNNLFTIEGTSYTGYVLSSVEHNGGDVVYANSDVEIFTEAEIAAYIESATRYTVNGSAPADVFVSSDNGDTKTQLTKGSTYTYNTGDLFYIPNATTYEPIADNATFFADHTSYLHEEHTTPTITLLEGIENAIANGNYTKVVVNGGTIDSDIIHSILYQKHENGFVWYTRNENLVELDLGNTTCKDFTSETLSYGSASGTSNIATITFPKVPVVGDKMTLPTDVVKNIAINTNHTLTTLNVPEGYTNIGEYAFLDIVNVTDINLPSTLKVIETRAFQSCSSLVRINATSDRSIVFPEHLETIGEYAFTACTALASTSADPLEFPSSVKYIKAAAFNSLLNIKAIKFNEGLEFIGNSAFMVPSYDTNDLPTREQKTMEYPSTLKYMGPGCFANRIYDDVYFKSTIAPAAPNGDMVVPYSGGNDNTAFDGFMHMANNGFDPGKKEGTAGANSDDVATGYANRDNYMNHEVYFTILHFRDDLTKEQAETFTDVTRHYETYRDADGKFWYPYTLYPGTETQSYSSYSSYYTSPGTEGYGAVAAGFEDTYLGMQKIWPSQAQWMRSYIMNSNGLKWNGVTTYRPTIPEDQLRYMAMDNLQTGGVTITDELINAVINKTDHTLVDNNNYTTTADGTMELSEYLSLIAYQGTRRFVLADADTKEDEFYPIQIEGGHWWTICIPFNMTKAEVDKFFGANSHVCLFSEVVRDAVSAEKKLTLKFQNDVYAHYTEKTSSAYASNFKITDPAATDDQIVIRAHEAYMIYPTKKEHEDGIYVGGIYQIFPYALVQGSPVPTNVTANDGENYRFIGNYQTMLSNAEGNAVKVTIPQYSYMYAKKSGDTAYKFWFDQSTKISWPSNKCVVQNMTKGGGAQDNEIFFTSTQAKQISVFGDWWSDPEEEATSVTIIAGDGENSEVVYNLNGQPINPNTFGTGIFIKNGKKYTNR